MKDIHTYGKEMARNGRTKDIYKWTFVCIQTLFERLVRPSKKDPNKKLFYITIENMFEPVYKVHQDSQHEERSLFHATSVIQAFLKKV